jgi:GT2 family glycosyltransferase
MKEAGWRVYFYPEAEVVHYGQQSVHKIPDWTQVQKYRNFYRFCRDNKLCTVRQLPFLKSAFIAACLVRMGLWGFRLFKYDRTLANGMIKGYWNVLKHVPSF